MVPAIRQNAGSAAKFAGGPPGTPPPPAGLKAPAGTSAASVIVVGRSLRFCESSLHEGAASTGCAVNNTARSSMEEIKVRSIQSPLESAGRLARSHPPSVAHPPLTVRQ